MTTPFLAPAAVRDYGGITGTTGQYSDASIGSNLRASASLLERLTKRQFTDVTATRTFTTQGRPQLYVGGLRSATSVTLAGSTLAADTTYWLLPDIQQSGVFIAIQLRPFNTWRQGPWWLSVPDWFDRNLDSPLYPGNQYGSMPNDLVIAGNWGYTAATIPDAYLLAEKALAYYITKRTDAILSGALTTPEGNIFDLSNLPLEVQEFVQQWRVSEQATSV